MDVKYKSFRNNINRVGMTRDEFMKCKFIPYMEIEYVHPNGVDGENAIASCLLLSVDFDSEIFRLQVLEDMFFEACEIHVHISYCRIPKKQIKLKLTK